MDPVIYLKKVAFLRAWRISRRNGDIDINAKENNAAEVNKEKPKKLKKPKVTVAEVAAKIDDSYLASFLSDISGSYEGQQDIQLMRFSDYFGLAFSGVSASQFPWLKLFRQTEVAKMADVPVSYISEAVYKTSIDWINHFSYDALGTFVFWSFDGILAGLVTQLLGPKGSRKGLQPASSKSQVAIFVVLAMVLRRKPDVLLILAAPKARVVLMNNAVRKGERLMPPESLDLLLHLTFPASPARVKATERFEAIYPILKEVALAGSPGSKSMKQTSLQIQTFSVKAAGEGIPALAQEACCIFTWCLTQNLDCYKQWDMTYVDNIGASVAALRKLDEEWKNFSSKQASLQALAETLKSFRLKNEKALSDDGHQAFFKDADKNHGYYCCDTSCGSCRVLSKPRCVGLEQVIRPIQHPAILLNKMVIGDSKKKF